VKIDEFDWDETDKCNWMNGTFSFIDMQLAHLTAFVEERYSYGLTGGCFSSICLVRAA